MKKTIFTLVLLILLQFCYSQDDYWEPIEIPDSVEMKMFDVSPLGNLILGTNKGLYVSYDDGNSWSMVGDSAIYASDFAFTSAGELYAGSSHIRKLDVSDSTWQLISFNDIGKIRWFFNSNDVFIISGWGRIARSIDYGYNWDTIMSVGTSQGFFDFVELDGTIFCASKAYISQQNAGIYTSDDEGLSWLHSALQGKGVRDLEVNYSNDILAGSEYGLYISGDTGLTWNNIFIEHVYAIASDVYGGIYVGVYNFMGYCEIKYSDDVGQSWLDISNGLDDTPFVLDLKINKNYFIFARTNYNDGTLYRSINKIVGLDHFDVPNEEITCYPNPCRDRLSIQLNEFDNPVISLQVYNYHGTLKKEITNLSNENLIEIDVSDLESGIYFLRISLQEGTRFVKFVRL